MSQVTACVLFVPLVSPCRWMLTYTIIIHFPQSFPGLQWWRISASECMSLTTACWAACIISLVYQSSFLLCSSHSRHSWCILFHQAHSEEISQERLERQRLERDLEEASQRLTMAHQDIRRLTNELDAAKNNNLYPAGMLQRLTVFTCQRIARLR